MSLLKMKLMVLIDRYKQITAVANALQIKQPTVSFHMKKMEEEWGVKLFEMRTGKVLLTKNGKLLLHYASQIDQLYSEAESRLGAIHAAEKNRFVIGCTTSTAAYLTSSAAIGKLRALTGSHAAVISVAVHDEDELYQKLHLGTIDFILYGAGKQQAEGSEFRYQTMGASPLRLIIPRQHPLYESSEERSLYSQLEKYEFVELADSSVAQHIHEWSRKCQYSLTSFASYGSVELLLHAAAASGDLAILPECLLPHAAKLEELELTLTVLDDEAARWTMTASWRSQHWDQAFMQQVLEIIGL
ncbi:LysR family transcriptional regulator [Paenibacillus sp. KS-LC4]|uniref:LysR family transcriptional regulator n=1 Tax=Paenibacillus sp. KS-LC4 TaxID=2979727 RepID=UPI0030D462A2